MAITTPCARCGINEVPLPKSVEEDPICRDCKLAMYPVSFNNDEGGCPGWNDSCGNTLQGNDDLCGDCNSARLDAQSPRVPR